MAGRGGAGAGSGVGLGAWGAGLAMDAKRNQGRVGAGWFDIMRRGLKLNELEMRIEWTHA